MHKPGKYVYMARFYAVLSSNKDVSVNDMSVGLRGIGVSRYGLLARWASRRLMDGHLLKKFVLFFICCLMNFSFLSRPYSLFWTATFQILAKSLSRYCSMQTDPLKLPKLHANLLAKITPVPRDQHISFHALTGFFS